MVADIYVQPGVERDDKEMPWWGQASLVVPFSFAFCVWKAPWSSFSDFVCIGHKDIQGHSLMRRLTIV